MYPVKKDNTSTKQLVKKFAGKYRIASARLQNWDYGWQGQYFITICTRRRGCYFGKIVDEQMILSETGEIAISEWLKSPVIRPDMNIQLDEFVIMPNHIHGIIQIGENKYNVYNGGDNINCRRDAMHGVSASYPDEGSFQKGKNKFGAQRKNLASIIRGFKSAVTINARMINSDFGWQSGFYDCIIRDEKSLKNIRKYIKDNPRKWTLDKLNPENK